MNTSEYCPTAFSNTATGVLSRRSVIVVTQSWFEGNNVGLGRVIDNYDSDIMIFNTTFVNNSATTYCYYNCCFNGSIVYANDSQGSTVKLYDCNFVQNVGVVIFPSRDNLLISHSKFINNSAPHMMMYATDSNNTFIDKIGQILKDGDKSIISIRYSEFVGNNASVSIVEGFGRMIVSVDHNKFTNNSGIVLCTENADTINIAHSEFVDNTVPTGYRSLINLDRDRITISLSEFINNRVYGEVLFIRYYILASNLAISKNVFIDNMQCSIRCIHQLRL